MITYLREEKGSFEGKSLDELFVVTVESLAVTVFDEK